MRPLSRDEVRSVDARAIGELAQKGQLSQAAGQAVRTLAFGWPDEGSWRQAREAALRARRGSNAAREARAARARAERSEQVAVLQAQYPH